MVGERWEVEEANGFLYVWRGPKDTATRRIVVCFNPIDGRDRAVSRLVEQAPAMLGVCLIETAFMGPDKELGDVCRRVGQEWFDAWLCGGRPDVLKLLRAKSRAVLDRVLGGGG